MTDENRTQFAEYQLLLVYLHRLLRFKYRIAIFSILVASLVLGLSFMLPDRFTARATVAINVSESPGGIQPSNYRGANTMGVIEYDFIIDGVQSNERERHLARVESFGFVSLFIEQQQLMPVLFPKQWDQNAQKWLDGFTPDMREAVKAFKSGMLFVKMDPKTDLLNVHITSTDPLLSATIANAFVDSFNRYLRNLEAEELGNRRGYLEQRLREVNNTEIHRSIYRLLEAQLAVESLINARANYPLEMIQPATVPLFESFPHRKKWTVLALVGSMFLGFFAVILFGMVSRIRKDLKALDQHKTGVKTQVEPVLSRDQWIDDIEDITT